MNTLFTSRLNGIFILNTLLELHKPVTVSELAGIINHRYDHVTAPRKMVSADTVKRLSTIFTRPLPGPITAASGFSVLRKTVMAVWFRIMIWKM